jgi:hypothetical protein
VISHPRHWPQASALIGALAEELEAAGVRVLDMRASSRVGLLVTAEVVVWCYGRLLHWRRDGEEMTWPAADAYGAARRLAGAGAGGRAQV